MVHGASENELWDLTTATRAPLLRGLADGPEAVLADAAGAAAPGPVEPVVEDVVAVHGLPVAAHEVELVGAVGEAALLAAESDHLLEAASVALALKYHNKHTFQSHNVFSLVRSFSRST